MKKAILLTYSMLIATYCGFSQTLQSLIIEKNNWETNNLNGRVKTVEESTFEAVDQFGEIQKVKLHFYNNWKYNDSGNLIEYSVGKIPSVVSTFQYNSEGNKIKENRYHTNGELEYSEIYIYDNYGNCIRTNRYHTDGNLKYSYVFVYNRNILIDCSHYNEVGQLERKYAYKYDDNSNLIEEIIYNEGGIAETFTTWKYDKNGNKIEQKSRRKNNIIIFTSKYKYDNKGNLIEIKINDGNGNTTNLSTFKYNTNGNLNEQIHYVENSILDKFEKFDDKSNLIEVVKYKENGGIENRKFFKIKYDQYGNWIEKIEYNSENLIPQFITERKFEYYLD